MHRTIPIHPRWLGIIVYLVFLFLVIVVLLNLLIAQMSDTYSSVQQDAQRSLAINRAWIVARVEHNSLLARVCVCTCIDILGRYMYIFSLGHTTYQWCAHVHIIYLISQLSRL